MNPIAGLDDLLCITQGNDVDGDSVSFAYEWTVDGVNANNNTDMVSVSDIADGEVWVCIVTPNDGTDDGSTSSASVTIGADISDATGNSFCAAAGYATDGTGYQSISCFSEVGIAGEETTDSTYNWQPGSIYIFSPE